MSFPPCAFVYKIGYKGHCSYLGSSLPVKYRSIDSMETVDVNLVMGFHVKYSLYFIRNGNDVHFSLTDFNLVLQIFGNTGPNVQ